MSLSSTLSIANSGLSNVSLQLALVSQNVANAGTPGYAREVAGTTDLTAGGMGYGVLTGPATRTIDQALQNAALAQDGEVAAQQTTQAAMAAIDATQGTTAAGNDMASQLGDLADAFTTLDSEPDNQAQQISVVAAAKTLAQGVNALSDAYQTGRQTAQDSLVSDVATLNTALQTIGTLSSQIVAMQVTGQSTADLENQRDAQEQTAAQLAGIRFIPQGTGNVLAVAGGGSLVNLAPSTTGPFAMAPATLGANSTAPALTLSGIDVTSIVTSGSIGANLTLRDTTLPLAQAGIDLFAKTLANRFDDQGLNLFTDPDGSPPSATGTNAASDIGFASIMQVNPAVSADPSAVRDGTATSSGGQTANPADGPAGYTDLIDRVTSGTFGANTAPATTGLGANGNLTLPYQASSTLAGFAANLLAAQSTASSAASDALTTGTALQTTLQAKIQDTSGVSVDTELSNMIQLQNSYGANAKVITAVQAMFTTLLDAVNPT